MLFSRCVAEVIGSIILITLTLFTVFRHHQLSLHHKHQIQVVGEEEPLMKTLMRREESFWSETGLLLPDAGRNGKSGCSRWRRRLRT